MKSLLKTEAVFGGLLVLSLAGKLALNVSDDSLVEDGPKFALTVARTLNEQGFETRVTFWPTGPQVQARRGDCFMWVRDYSPHGTTKNIIMALAEPVGELRYTYRGKIGEEPPKVLPLIRFFLRREAARIGILTPRYPIYAVAVNADCSLQQTRLPEQI